VWRVVTVDLPLPVHVDVYVHVWGGVHFQQLITTVGIK